MLPSSLLLFHVFLLSSSHLCFSQTLPLQPPPPPQCDQSFTFVNSTKNITRCKKLWSLGAELGWNLHNTTNSSNAVAILDIVFAVKSPSPNGWVAWGVNPGPKPRMVGTRALIAIGQPNGSPVVATYNVTADVKKGCKLENSSIELRVENMRAQYSAGTGVMTLWARLNLPSDYNVSGLNQVWQVGANAAGMVPRMHAMKLENFDSAEKIDLVTGRSLGHSMKTLRVAHGMLSVIGWGFLVPIGAFVIRYFRTFPFKRKKWFVAHASIQLTAYIIGTTAWGIGLSLTTNAGHAKSFMGHRIIGILIFCLATLQITALWLKPSRNDKYRKYWSIYHHTVGYAVVALAIANIFKGFAILRPAASWRWAYIGILSGLAFVALLLEIVTWVKFYWKGLRKDTNEIQPQAG